jgi:hypothetical protein
MKIGGVFTIGGVFLLLIGAGAAALFGWPVISGKGHAFNDILAVLVLGVIPMAAGLSLLGAGSRRSKLEKENEERGFAETVTALARKRGGQVAIGEVCQTTSLPTDEAQARMRALCGRGVFDLDFDANGQMVYKLSTAQGAAQLAQLSGRS